jgi:hypothetical protein
MTQTVRCADVHTVVGDELISYAERMVRSLNNY